MTNQQILKKAIHKAVEGGWDILGKAEAEGFTVREDAYGNAYVAWHPNPDSFREEDSVGVLAQSWQEIIYNHDFAKALWGDGDGQTIGHEPADWQYHLQQMVIAPDPIKYLGENL